jgi:hypothetical protein
MRVKITEKRVGDAAKAVCPGYQGGNTIYRKAQNLSL